jgi:ElaB/YqjD/DUF883 family membrane-anchored ribosome-binding protein
MLLSADVQAQPADVIGEHRRDTSQLSSTVAIGDRTRAHGGLNIRVAERSASAPVISAAQEAPAPTRRDSLLNGVLIGAGVGALVGLIPDHYDDCEECHDSLYASIGVGAGVGLLVDLLRVKSTAPSSSGPRTSLMLGVGPPSARVRVGGVVRWR